MATTTTVHGQLIRYDSSGNQTIINLKSTGTDVSVDRSQNTKLPSSVSTVQTLANALKALAFKDSLSKSDVGLGSVDNTADANKSVKYATSAGSATSASNVKDIGNGATTTFAYSKAGLDYGAYTWIAAWNGTELRAVNKNQFAQASHSHSYLPLSGGTVSGRTTFSQGNVVFSATGEAGKTGFVNIATIKVTGNYQNEPLEITFSRRSDVSVTRLSIAFTSANNVDPPLGVFKCMGATNAAWLYKSAASTWQLYIQKTEGYDTIGILDYRHPDYMSGVSITWTNKLITTLPTSGITQASYGYNVGYASSAGYVAWGNVGGKTNASATASGLMSSADKAKLDFGDILYVSKTAPTKACIWAKLD